MLRWVAVYSKKANGAQLSVEKAILSSSLFIEFHDLGIML